MHRKFGILDQPFGKLLPEKLPVTFPISRFVGFRDALQELPRFVVQ